jgi:hypothetical protein
MAVQTPEECHWIMRHNTVRAALQVTWNYWEWLRALDKADLTRLLEDYRRQVQVLQAPDPSRRWLSKTFAHMHFWPVLFDVFPDAQVVRIHRDPRRTVASAGSLALQLARGGDPMAVGQMTVDVLADGLGRMMAADVGAPEGQATDILYDDLVRAPVQTLFELARRLGVPSPETFRGRVERYFASPRRLRPAPHGYDLEEFGLTGADISSRFEAYTDWVRARISPGFGRQV